MSQRARSGRSWRGGIPTESRPPAWRGKELRHIRATHFRPLRKTRVSGLTTVALVAEPDPNWLLSTTAQSTAALVAIVGGFLLSRVLALAAERNGLALREAQLGDEVKLAEETYRFQQRRIDDSDRADFLDDAIDLLVDDPAASIEDLDKDTYGDLHAGELAELFESIRARVKVAVEALKPHVPSSGWLGSLGSLSESKPFNDVLPQLEITEDEDVELFSKVWRRLVPFSSILLAPPSPRFPVSDPYNNWIRERDRALDDRARAVGQLEIVRTELAKVSAPTGIGRLTASLAFFLATGVVGPIAILVQQPTRLAQWQAWLTFVGFAIGLIVVAIAVGITVREAFPRHTSRTEGISV